MRWKQHRLPGGKQATPGLGETRNHHLQHGDKQGLNSLWSSETALCEMKNLQAETVAKNIIINDFSVATVSVFFMRVSKRLNKDGDVSAHTHTQIYIANKQNLGLK